jgi:hypothetical protein
MTFLGTDSGGQGKIRIGEAPGQGRLGLIKGHVNVRAARVCIYLPLVECAVLFPVMNEYVSYE